MKSTLKKALKPVGRYLGLDILYLIRGGFWITLSQIVGAATVLGLTVVYANYVPPDVFGKYKYVLAAAALFSAFSLTGLGTALKLSAAQRFDGDLIEGYWASLRWSGVVAFGALAFSVYYFIRNDTVLGTAFLLIALFKPLMAAANLHLGFIEGKSRFQLKAFFSIFHTITTSGAVLLAILFSDHVIPMLLAYFGSNVTVHTFLFLYAKHNIVKNSGHQPGFLSYAKHTSLMSVLMRVANNLDKILMFQFVGATQLAIYTFSSAPITELNRVSKMLKLLAFPKIAKRNIPQLQAAIPRKALQIFIGALCIVGLYILTAPYIFELLFPKYIEAVHYSQVLVLSILFYPRILLMQTLIAVKFTKGLYIINIVTPLTRIAFMFLLLPLYGIWGAVTALLLGETIMTLLIYYYYRKLVTENV